MFLKDETEKQNLSSSQENSSDDQMPSFSYNTEQTIMFPYVGPPGAGPGLLGSKPGSGKLEHLIALEHHASSLKSALAIAATLKGVKTRLNAELIYDSACDFENEWKSFSESIARPRQE
ncbi:uncharacterized protein LOC129969158 isoform X2 [Argiope bruennichi]|uniref:Uncharacterized protein n=1 Tax=Argiope bruennichi TaxID=94029 RepID=A0A8T0FTW1_ARGBR|nr:uncharacterized protein LOC129969158 isoform X2 [Argiope bruennichi]XP_055939564.1 uncharacterized protein LOC129969158 isoform X2 [Argiope bruennichi]XP_055939565.1 uncharacterized protein LOC129969158 isoform X2 [Argiope bruennichi]KAF8792163.1 hypothetical protein HNY73_003801 [Argiope bruennichi]